jgi:hypothetical protein
MASGDYSNIRVNLNLDLRNKFEAFCRKTGTNMSKRARELISELMSKEKEDDEE